jgi:hypothetical protein
MTAAGIGFFIQLIEHLFLRRWRNDLEFTPPLCQTL